MAMMFAVSAAVFGLAGKTTVFKAGWFEITLANLIVFVLLLAVFVLAIALPFPGRRHRG